METYLEIAGIIMQLSVPFSYEMAAEFQPFHIASGLADAEIVICFCPTETPIVYDEKLIQGECYQIAQKDGKRYLSYHIYDNPPHVWMETDDDKVICHYMEDGVKLFPTERQLVQAFSLEHILNLHHGFILHSSFIRWGGKGILFSAPSGTGKSTQAALWEQYEQADILNGDRAAIRKVDGKWRAYGLPFAGSSNIYRNESCPLCAIIVLEQGKKNKIERLSGGEAFPFLYREITMHPWDEAFMRRFLDDFEQLIVQVPVYLLTCRPDQEAVAIVKRKLEEITDGE